MVGTYGTERGDVVAIRIVDGRVRYQFLDGYFRLLADWAKVPVKCAARRSA